jgi:putative membrane protein
MKLMVKDHKHDLAAFKQEAKDGRDPAVKEFASKTLPTLEEHLKLAQDAERAVSAQGNR